MSHDCTREVRLAAMPADPLDFEVNYYDYMTRRLIPSTDVTVGGTLAYRSNALGCRGDDLEPGVPVIAVLGGGFVHDGGFVERAAVPGVRLLNAGVEGLSLPEVLDRLDELRAAVPLAGVVLAPPPVGPGDSEADWPGLLDRLAGPPLVAVIPLALMRQAGGPAAEPVWEAAFDAALARWAPRGGAVLLEPPTPSLMGRLLGRKAGGQADLAAVLSALEGAVRRLGPLPSPRPPTTAEAAAGKGAAEDVGRNYPLW